MKHVFNDGGRSAAGYKGRVGDCVVRSIAIATGKSYQEVYDALNEISKKERPRKGQTRSSSRGGVHRKTLAKYLVSLGWEFFPTMKIGQGCKVHLREGEFPSEGTYIVSLSRHYSSVIDGVIHDTHDPSRRGWRCVYGYWKKIEKCTH